MEASEDTVFESRCEFCDEAIEYESEHICCVLKFKPPAEEGYQMENGDAINDVESFIDAIRHKRILWDSTLPYTMRSAASVKLVWAELDHIFNVTRGVSQTKWRNLRDTYVRKCAEQKKYVRSGSGAISRPKKETWPYFELMEFLRPAVGYKRTHSNIEVPTTTCSNYKPHFKKPLLEKKWNENYNISQDSEETIQENKSQSTSFPTVAGPSSTDLNQRDLNLLTPSPTFTIVSTGSTSDSSQTSIVKRRRTIPKNKQDDFAAMQNNLMEQLKTTDSAINSALTLDSQNPVFAFTSYLACRMKKLSEEKFEILQRKILQDLFQVEDA